jgi:hypothetical protein
MESKKGQGGNGYLPTLRPVHRQTVCHLFTIPGWGLISSLVIEKIVAVVQGGRVA